MQLRFLRRKWKTLMKAKFIEFDNHIKRKYFFKFIQLNKSLNINNCINITKGLLMLTEYLHRKVSNLVLKQIFFIEYKLKKLMNSNKKKEVSVKRKFFEDSKINTNSQILDQLRKIKLKLILFNTVKTKIQIMIKYLRKFQRNSKNPKEKQKNVMIKAGFLFLLNILYKSIRNPFRILRKNLKYCSDFTRIMRNLDKKIKLFHFISFCSKLTLYYTNTLKRKNILNTLKYRLFYSESVLSYNKTICFILWKNYTIYKKNDNKCNSKPKIENKIKKYIYKLKSKKIGTILVHILTNKVNFYQKRLRYAINFWKNKEIIIYSTRKIKHIFDTIFIIYRIRFIRNLSFIFRNSNRINLFTEFLVAVFRKILMKTLFKELKSLCIQNDVLRTKKIISIKNFVLKKDEKITLLIQRKLNKWINSVKKYKSGGASYEISGYFSKLLKRTNINKAKNIVKMVIKQKYERIRSKQSVIMNNWNRIAKLELYESSVEVLQKFLRKKLENSDKVVCGEEGFGISYKKVDRNDFSIGKHIYK